MARIAVIGDPPAVDGFGLVGALVLAASGTDEVRAAWKAVPTDVAVLVLSAAAARDLDGLPLTGAGPLTVVMPA